MRWAHVSAVLAVLATPAIAADMQVAGEVIDVVPLGGTATAGPAPGCQPPRPRDNAGLAELLAWDLRLTCPRASPAAGYRVFYRWDGRTYSMVMQDPPGATVPLRVRID